MISCEKNDLRIAKCMVCTRKSTRVDEGTKILNFSRDKNESACTVVGRGVGAPTT